MSGAVARTRGRERHGRHSEVPTASVVNDVSPPDRRAELLRAALDTLDFVHRAFGYLPTGFIEGVDQGWNYGLKRIAEIAGRMKSKKGASR